MIHKPTSMHERSGSNGGGEYRYGFQGQEKDDELWGGAIGFKYRVEDPRLGRFFSIDPLYRIYPFWSPYIISGNILIAARELEGMEPELPFRYDEQKWLEAKSLQGESSLTASEIDLISKQGSSFFVSGPNPLSGMLVFECTDCKDSGGSTNQKQNYKTKKYDSKGKLIAEESKSYDYAHPIYKAAKLLSDEELAEKFRVAEEDKSIVTEEDRNSNDYKDVTGRFGMILNTTTNGEIDMNSSNNGYQTRLAISLAKKHGDQGIIIWPGNGGNIEDRKKVMLQNLRDSGYTGKVTYAEKGDNRPGYFTRGTGPQKNSAANDPN